MTPRAIVALEFDLYNDFKREGAGIKQVVAHLGAGFDAMKEVVNNAGLPGVAAHLAPASNSDDVAWFAQHPDRTRRLRYAAADEFVLTLPGAPLASCLVVQQISPGVRLICPVPDGVTDPRVEPLPFFDNDDPEYPDRDFLLGFLVEALCRYPGCVLDIDKLIEQTWLHAPRANTSRN
jgi:hypothetical protein